MTNVENIENHYAYACDECGDVNFFLLKSGAIECAGCGDRANIEWGAMSDPDKRGE